MELRIPLVRKRRVMHVHRQLPAAKIDDWFHTAYGFELNGHGFEQVGRRRWVRSAKVPIREGIQINALKGYSFAPFWFVSLDPVPDVTAKGHVRWHRTPASALPDLRLDPMDAPDSYDMDALVVSGMQTPADAKEAIKRSTKLTVALALDWFARVTDLPSLVSLYEEVGSRPTVRFGPDNYPQHRLSFAFVLKATGYDILADQEFTLWTQRCGRDVPVAAIDELLARLRAVPRARAG